MADQRNLDELIKKHSRKRLARVLAENPHIINMRNSDGLTLLHLYAKSVDYDSVKFLLDSNADPNITDRFGDSLLFNYPHIGKKVIELLIAYKVDVNARCSGTGDTLLHEAAADDNEALMKLLLDNKADVNAVNDNNESPIFVSYTFSNLNLLLDYKADINIVNLCGDTILTHAEWRSEGVLKKVLDLGADPNHMGSSCALLACRSLETLKMVLDYGADPNLLLQYNEGICYKDAIALLLEYGLDPMREDKNGQTLLHHITNCSDRLCGCHDTIAYVLEYISKK